MLTQARVDFKKPNIEELKKKKEFTLVDMHVHSRYSDGMNRVKTIIKKSKSLGIGISITDHNEVKGCIKAAGDKDVMLIPGIETTTYEGIHMLFYFFSVKDLEELDKFLTDKIRSLSDIFLTTTMIVAKEYKNG